MKVAIDRINSNGVHLAVSAKNGTLSGKFIPSALFDKSSDVKIADLLRDPGPGVENKKKIVRECNLRLDPVAEMEEAVEVESKPRRKREEAE